MDALGSTLALLKHRIAARDRAGINQVAVELINRRAPIGAQYAALATLLQHHGEHDAALRALDAWQATGGPRSRIAYDRAATLARAGRAEQARVLMESMPPDVPDAASNAYMKGTLANDLGDRDGAMRELSRAVALNPASGRIWLARAMAGPLANDEHRTLDALQSSFAPIATSDSAAYSYALGKVRDEQGDHGAAFAAFDHGSRIMARLHPFDAKADAARATAEIEAWTPAALRATRAGIDRRGSPPIFVTGLPRSGTTLVEQILVSHSAVVGGGELSLFGIIGRDVGGLSHAALQAWCARGGDPQALRDLYDHLAAQRVPAPGRIVDKTLTTSRHLGLIATLFADAPIVWLRRDPIDCAWSVFRSFFVKGVDWGWSLRSIAEFFIQEDRLFAHWQRVLGDQILVVPFDALVGDPERWTGRITHHVGLALEPAQLTPHLTGRAVTTNSAAQVREAIHQRGIGSAQPYRAYLGEFLDQYGAPALSPR